jgi:hypothetical protein
MVLDAAEARKSRRLGRGSGLLMDELLTSVKSGTILM